MSIRKTGHLILDKLFEYSLYVSSIALVTLSVIDISNLNEKTIDIFGIPKLEIGKIVYYISVFLAIVFGFFSVNNASEISSIEKDLEEKNAKVSDLENALTEVVSETNELFNSYLKLLVKSLSFTFNERISVYKVFDNTFVMIGRTSESTQLKGTGRANYPLNEGFIGKGWNEGEYFIDDLPDPSPRNGDTYYRVIADIVDIPRDVIDSLTMKSRTYYILRMNGYDDEPKAVLVAESLNQAAFSKQEIEEKLDSVRQPLIMFIEKMSNTNYHNSSEVKDTLDI